MSQSFTICYQCRYYETTQHALKSDTWWTVISCIRTSYAVETPTLHFFKRCSKGERVQKLLKNPSNLHVKFWPLFLEMPISHMFFVGRLRVLWFACRDYFEEKSSHPFFHFFINLPYDFKNFPKTIFGKEDKIGPTNWIFCLFEWLHSQYIEFKQIVNV